MESSSYIFTKYFNISSLFNSNKRIISFFILLFGPFINISKRSQISFSFNKFGTLDNNWRTNVIRKVCFPRRIFSKYNLILSKEFDLYKRTFPVEYGNKKQFKKYIHNILNLFFFADFVNNSQ